MNYDTMTWVAIGLVASVWLLTVSILRYVRSCWQTVRRQQADVADIRASHKWKTDLLNDNISYLKQLVEARTELEHLRHRDIA